MDDSDQVYDGNYMGDGDQMSGNVNDGCQADDGSHVTDGSQANGKLW